MAVRSQAFRCAIVIALFAYGGCKKSGPSNSVESKNRQLNIAAAADLKFALDDIAAQFRKPHPDIDVRITYGSSGNFYSQLTNRAPFDLFLSADETYVDKLSEAGLAGKGSKFLYAVGQIVLWVPKNSPLDLEKLGLSAVAEPSVRKLAIANPQHAPYGRAAETALRTHQLWEKVQEKLVMGENIAQTAQFAQSGVVDAAIIALSLARSPMLHDSGRYMIIRPEDYPPLRQAGIILSGARDASDAEQFRQFLTSGDSRQILRNYGFGPP